MLENAPYTRPISETSEYIKLMRGESVFATQNYVSRNNSVVTYDNGDFKSLTDEQINEVYDICNKREIINLFELEDSNGKEFE